jgi:hypothetical protein
VRKHVFLTFSIALLWASTAMAQTAGGIFGAAAPPPVLANVTLSTTAGTAVPANVVGFSEPLQSDIIFLPLATNCGNGTYEPNCVNGAIYQQLLANWTTVSGGRQIQFRQGANYSDYYNYACLNVPIGLPVTGGWAVSTGGIVTLTTNNTMTYTATFDGSTAVLTSALETSMPEQGIARVNAPVTGTNIPVGDYITAVNTAAAPTQITLNVAPTGAAGTITITVQNQFAGDTVYVYDHSSSAATTAGLDNPMTPAGGYVAPYTLTAATATTLTFTIPSYTHGALSGTDFGYSALSVWWEPNSPPTGTCSGGGGGSGASLGGTKVYPPTSLLTGPLSTLILGNSHLSTSVELNSSQAQYCNGHRMGPYVDSYGNQVPAPNRCLASDEVPAWIAAFSSNPSQLQLFEPMNESDNYATDGASWNFRTTGYTSFSQGILNAGALTPGSGQTPGTYTINASTGAGQIQVVIPSTGTYAGQCASANVTVTNAGTTYFPAGGMPSPPTFTMPTTAGTTCTLEASVDNTYGNIFDMAAATSSARGGIGLLAPSEASGATYDWVLYGGATSSATVPSTPVPTWPTANDLASHGVTVLSRHNYAYGGTAQCPSYPLSGISRSTSSGNGTLSLTTSVPTNFATSIPLVNASYNSGDGLVRAYLADNEAIVSHSNYTPQGMPTQVTMNTASAPVNIWVGEYVQTNGFTVDTKLNGANPPFQVIAVGASSYTVSTPSFSDTSTDTGGGYDQPYIYSGSKLTVTGSTGNVNSTSTTNVTGQTIGDVKSSVHPAYFDYTTAGTTITDATATGGSFVMYGSDNNSSASQQEGLYENIMNTPLGSVASTGLDVLTVPCSAYSYPCLNGSGNNFPYYGSHSGYGQGNTHQIGAIPLTWTSPTTASFTQTGSLGTADNAYSGSVAIVTGTATNTTISPVYNASCYPGDILMNPITSTRGVIGTNAGTLIETEGIAPQFGAYPYTSSITPLPFIVGETNSETGATGGVANAHEQALWVADYAAQLFTLNGVNGTTNSAGNTYSSPAALPGFAGVRLFSGNLTSYSFFEFNDFCSATGTPLTSTCALLDKTTDTGSPIQPLYTGVYALLDFLKVNTFFPATPILGSSNIMGLTISEVIDSQSPAHVHVQIVNRSEAVSGPVTLTVPGMTAGTANFLDVATTVSQSVLTFNPTITALSGSTATFCVPTATVSGYTGTTTNLYYNMPLQFTGYVSNAWLNGQTVYVLTHGTACSGGTTFTALVTPGTLTAGESGKAGEICSVGTTQTPNVANCQWGEKYGGGTPTSDMTWEGSRTGVAIGTDVPLPLTASSNVFTVNVPAASITVLDLHP